MYVYIYDADIEKRKNNKTLIKIEERVTELGLNGKIVRLSGIKNIEKAIKDELRYEISTMVVVGNDCLFYKTLNTILEKQKEGSSQRTKPPVLGMIPLEPKSSFIGRVLGLGSGSVACDAILSRRIKRVNVGKVGKGYFLVQLEIRGSYHEIKIGDDYSIEIQKPCDVTIVNPPLSKCPGEESNDESGSGGLKLYIEPQKRKIKNRKSFLPIENVFITNKTEKIIIDKCLEVKGGAEVSLTNKEISLIVGKERGF